MPASKPTTALPLAGATLLLTQPADSARALRTRVRALGGTPLRLPGLSVCVTREPLRAIQPLRTAHALWVFTSPAAVRACFALLPAWRPRSREVVLAVGAGTRRALARRGVAARAPQAGASSEALLALPELAAPQGRHVALVTARGGRNLIAPTLRQRGARVEIIEVYERHAARLSRRHFDALAAAPTPWLTLLSSAEALDHLCRAVPPVLAARWRTQPLIVASARLAALAQTQGFAQIRVARSALAEDLLATAAQHLARQRF